MSEGAQNIDSQTLDTESGDSSSELVHGDQSGDTLLTGKTDLGTSPGISAEPLLGNQSTDSVPTDQTEQGTSLGWNFEVTGCSVLLYIDPLPDTIPHFDILKIHSCRKHCEKWRNCL